MYANITEYQKKILHVKGITNFTKKNTDAKMHISYSVYMCACAPVESRTPVHLV